LPEAALDIIKGKRFTFVPAIRQHLGKILSFHPFHNVIGLSSLFSARQVTHDVGMIHRLQNGEFPLKAAAAILVPALFHYRELDCRHLPGSPIHASEYAAHSTTTDCGDDAVMLQVRGHPSLKFFIQGVQSGHE